MDKHFFNNLYGQLGLPVVVCPNCAVPTVAYMNMQAKLMFAPASMAGEHPGVPGSERLEAVVRFHSEEEFNTFWRQLRNSGRLDAYPADVMSFDGKRLPLAITAGSLLYEEADFLALFLLQRTADASLDSRFSAILNASVLEEDVGASIQTVLALSGRQVAVGRATIFEAISGAAARGTYEWCAYGVPSVIQYPPKESYPYSKVVEAGLFACEDTHTLPAGLRQLLGSQGIRALVSVPMYDYEKPLGTVSFGDTVGPRAWSHDEIAFLKNVALLLASLLRRRNSEQRASRSQEILKLVTGYSGNIIYANSLKDHRLLFASDALAQTLGTTPDTLLERPCWEIFGASSGPCSHCPMKKLEIKPEQECSDVYTWEYTHERLGKTYLVKDSLVPWVDGQLVHLAVAVDITDRVEYEQKLRHFASTDGMTGLFNRQWGMAFLEDKMDDPDGEGTLCFLDVDGLKQVNDELGHAVGDEMLLEITQAIRNELTNEDFACRWGGDEFLLWMHLPEQAAKARVAAIENQLEETNAQGQRPYTLSFSYGLVPFLPGHGTLDALVTQADKRMYHSKAQKGGNLRRRWDDH